jgi:hypothetical protein
MFFKKVAAVFIGVISSFLVAALLVGLLTSNNSVASILGMVIVMTTIGAIVISGIYSVITIGRELCERIFGWWY